VLSLTQMMNRRLISLSLITVSLACTESPRDGDAPVLADGDGATHDQGIVGDQYRDGTIIAIDAADDHGSKDVPANLVVTVGKPSFLEACDFFNRRYPVAAMKGDTLHVACHNHATIEYARFQGKVQGAITSWTQLPTGKATPISFTPTSPRFVGTRLALVEGNPYLSWQTLDSAPCSTPSGTFTGYHLSTAYLSNEKWTIELERTEPGKVWVKTADAASTAQGQPLIAFGAADDWCNSASAPTSLQLLNQASPKATPIHTDGEFNLAFKKRQVSMSVDAQDNIHLINHGLKGDCNDLVYWKWNSASPDPTPTRLSFEPDKGYAPIPGGLCVLTHRTVIDASNRPHVVYSSLHAIPNRGDFAYFKRISHVFHDGQGWKHELLYDQNLPAQIDGPYDHFPVPDAIISGKRLFAAWNQGGTIRYALKDLIAGTLYGGVLGQGLSWGQIHVSFGTGGAGMPPFKILSGGDPNDPEYGVAVVADPVVGRFHALWRADDGATGKSGLRIVSVELVEP
jgi:hypothetical protein